MMRLRRPADRRSLNALRAMRFESLETRQLLTSVPWGADSQDTAEFMLGDVVVSVVLLESNGSLDANHEDWTPEAVQRVKYRVEQGLQWWEDLLAKQGSVHELDFQLDFTYADEPVSTGYEAIARPSDDFLLWIEDFFDQAGVESDDSFSEKIWEFNHAQRLKHDTNWAFTIFVVNAENDSDGRFDPSGSFSQSFAFAGGRFFVTTSRRPASAFTHETAHMFWALDEYAGGRPYAEHRGYYRVQNLNAADGHPDPNSRVVSIMDSHVIAYPSGAASPSALEMIGWRDSDHDGIFDVLDVPHSLEGTGTYRDGESIYQFRGQSRVGTLPNLNPSGSGHDMTINQISHVEVRFDSLDWQIVETYGQYEVELDLRIPVPAGAQIIEVRTVDSRTGVTSPTFQDSLLPSENSWQNPSQALDVNGDRIISPLDALLVINALNHDGARVLPPRPAGEDPIPYLDSSGDGFLSALDALLIINALNSQDAALPVPAVVRSAEAPLDFTPEGEIGASWSRFAAAVDAAFHQDDRRSASRRFRHAHPMAGDELGADPLRNAAVGEAT